MLQTTKRRALFVWNRRVLSIGGMWPLERSYVRCNLWIVYLAVQWSLGIFDLLDVANDLILFSLSFSETIVQTMVIVKLIVLRYSNAFYRTIMNVDKTFQINAYTCPEEQKIYMIYYNLAKKFYTIMMIFGVSTPVCYHLKPLQTFFMSGKFGTFFHS